MIWSKLRATATAIVFLLINQNIYSQDTPIKFPTQRTVKLALPANVVAPKAKWKIEPLNGQKAEDIEWISDTKGTSIRWIAPVGDYRVMCLYGTVDKDGVVDFDWLTWKVTIGDAVPDPAPVPVPVVNDLTNRLRATITPADIPDAKKYALVYKAGVKFAQANPESTFGKLWQAMESEAVAQSVNGKLIPFQTVLAKYLSGLGWSSADATLPATLPAELTKIVQAIEALR